MQFGARPLFENISVKFGNGNRYGLIGANGCGKSTLMKILGGDLEATAGTVMVEPNIRVGKLRQDQFAFENHTVIDTVIMGHGDLWTIKQERDRIYSLPEMSEEDGMKVADLEVQFAEMDGYSAEARAGELLLGLEIPIEQHNGPMSAVAPGWKLRVLLAQALFADPDIMLLDEPTNNLAGWKTCSTSATAPWSSFRMIVISSTAYAHTWPILTTVSCAYTRATTMST